MNGNMLCDISGGGARLATFATLPLLAIMVTKYNLVSWAKGLFSQLSLQPRVSFALWCPGGLCMANRQEEALEQ